MRCVSDDSRASRDYAQWVQAPPLPEHPIPARSSYFICGSPRSGTWLLSGLLASTRVAGNSHEYFWSETEAANRRNWGASSTEYVSRVLEVGTTENGVFACKLMWGYVPDFIERLESEAGGGHANHGSLVADVFPRPRFVWVRREDVVAQAVSWARAIQTGYWHHWDVAGGEARFDFDQIDALVREASEHNEAWQRWFAENTIDALWIRFEDLVRDKEGVTREVLRFLAIEIPASRVISALTETTPDASNEDWVARYRATTVTATWGCT